MEDNTINTQGEVSNIAPEHYNNKQSTDSGSKHKTLMISGLCLAFGIMIGGIIVAIGMLEFAKTHNACPECDCQSGATGQRYESLDSVDYGFLKMELASENILYSPLSIRNGLALLQSGASGETKAEIDSVLTSANLPEYQNIPDTLSLANAVFVRDTFSGEVLPSYVSTMQDNYGAEVLYDNFTSSTNMDNWVSQKTFGLINNIGIQPKDDLEMVLANALAIQMDWQEPFDTEDTGGKPFYQANGSEITATTMVQETFSSDVNYYMDDKVTMVSMPLETVDGATLEFAAIMPEGDLGDYIENFDSSTLDSIFAGSNTANEAENGLNIYIPKFKFDYTLDFKRDLENLGIRQAFDRELADFSNMASKPLYVSEAIHKANIDFSEDGIKAAAVTAFGMTDAAAMVDKAQPTMLEINRPFLFVIRDKSNGTIWFAGAVYQPNLWADDVADYY